MRKNKRKEKSIVVSQNLIHLVVPPTFLSGSTPLIIRLAVATAKNLMFIEELRKSINRKIDDVNASFFIRNTKYVSSA